MNETQQSPIITAVRGAAGVATDTPEQIARTVQELMSRLLQKNHIDTDDIISIILSVTDDIRTQNPATALRTDSRYNNIPLLCVQEMRCENSMTRVIRVLVHIRRTDTCAPVPIYINGAEQLRPDLQT